METYPMRKIELFLGKAQRRILQVLLDGVLEKAKMETDDIYLFVRIKNGKPVNPATLVEKE
jgi:hypothetical protein